MEGCEKWKRRGTYRRHGLRQELFRALWKTRLRKGFPSEIVASQVPPRVAGVAVSDDREGEKSRAWVPTSRVKWRKEGKSYSQGQFPAWSHPFDSCFLIGARRASLTSLPPSPPPPPRGRAGDTPGVGLCSHLLTREPSILPLWWGKQDHSPTLRSACLSTTNPVPMAKDRPQA